MHRWFRERRRIFPRRALLGFVRLRRQQQLNSEVSLEIGLISPRRFEAASGHEDKDYGVMDFVAPAEGNRRLILGRVKTTLVVKLHVEFEFWSEFVAEDEAGEPGVRSLVHELVTDFVVDVDRPKLSGEIERQQEAL